MALTNQPNFLSDLDGTNINELNGKIDYTKNKLDERKEIVEDILEDTSFYEEYFSYHYNPEINTTDYLSEDNNVSKSLEKMANYLLSSDEIKEEQDKEKTEYVFHQDPKYFKKKVDRERSVTSSSSNQTGEHEENVIHFLKSEQSNVKKQKLQKIKLSDLNRTDLLGEVLRNYNDYLKLATHELTNENRLVSRYILTNNIHRIKDDMIVCKDSLLGVFGYNPQNVSESTEHNLDVFDFTNEVHLKGLVHTGEDGRPVKVDGLLYFKPYFDPEDDFSLILTDLDRTIKKALLTEEEEIVLDGIRHGVHQKDIAHSLSTNDMKVSRIIDKIVSKVIKVGDTYDKDHIENEEYKASA